MAKALPHFALLPSEPTSPEQGRDWFNYDLAFSRNIGWLTEAEQQKLRQSKIAIAGMGGVGGVHMLTMARLGIGHFSVADFDRFEVGNFNRQAGASARTLGQPKVQSVAMLAREINPELNINIFEKGVTESNIHAFLDGASVYVDGLDFFVLDIRRKVFALARQKGIPAVTAAPIGMGTGYLIFTPDGMSFDDYFGFKDGDDQGNYVRFLCGLTPAMLHRSYLQDPTRVDFVGKRGPSTAIACELCAGVAASEVVKLVLGRGPVKAAPYYHHFDAYRGKHVVRKLHFGVDGPWMSLKRRAIAKLTQIYSRRARPAEEELPSDATVVQHIINTARWAPSPDNSQPWRFETQDDLHFTVTLNLEADNPYQFRGSMPNWLSLGMMVEALRLSALDKGYMLAWRRLNHCLAFELTALNAPSDPLCHYIKSRHVDRAAYQRRAISAQSKAALDAAVGPGFDLKWLDTPKARLSYAKLAARSTMLRLRSKACYSVHQDVIDWQDRFSRTGLPAQALGVNPISRTLLKWGLQSWGNMQRLNRWLRADILAALEMDILPGIFSGGYVVVTAQNGKATGPDDHLVAGSRLYRLWLEATRQGLAFQPALGPLLILAAETGDAPLLDGFMPHGAATSVSEAVLRLTGLKPDDIVFAARMGYPRKKYVASRSIRHLVATIMVNKP
jgi:sulfur-carrier protein adenylyltransferase/sulfurtransferase